MAKDTPKKENPLLSKNIPRPPTPPAEQAEKMSELENGKTLPEHSAQTVNADNGFSRVGQVEEKATIEVSLYLRPSQDDKVEDLKREYKRRTRRKISSNQLMRLLIDRATIDDLL